MCLTIQSPHSYCRYKNRLLGVKTFIVRNNTCPVIAGYRKDHYSYKFKKFGNGLLAKPDNTDQEVGFVFPCRNIGEPNSFSIEKIWPIFPRLGYHISPFSEGQTNIIFSSIKGMEKIPIIVHFNKEDIQLIGEGMIVNSFGLFHPEEYSTVIKLLTNLERIKLILYPDVKEEQLLPEYNKAYKRFYEIAEKQQ